MEEKDTELRMYFFVPYNLSPIQQAIQAGHAALEYGWQYKDTILFRTYIRDWKTWIILNGGTTNDKRDFDGVAQGTLNQIADQLREKNVRFSYFEEPDLNDALTAVCFICDERVWNYEDYPDFLNWVFKVYLYAEPASNVVYYRMKEMPELIKMFPEYHREWVKVMGGEENLFLRDLIRDKRLA